MLRQYDLNGDSRSHTVLMQNIRILNSQSLETFLNTPSHSTGPLANCSKTSSRLALTKLIAKTQRYEAPNSLDSESPKAQR